MKKLYFLFFLLPLAIIPTACEKVDSPPDNSRESLSNNAGSTNKVDEALIYYYPFDGNSQDQVSGQMLETNGATFGEDRFGNQNGALLMEENVLHLDAGFSDTQGTVSFWINVREFDYIVSLFKKASYLSSPDYYFLLHDDGSLSTAAAIKWGFVEAEGGGYNHVPLTTKPVIEKGKWYHIVLRWSDARKQIEIFVNNKKILSSKYTKTWRRIIYQQEPVATMGWISNYQGNHEWENWYFRGRLDDLQRYKCWISDHKIKELYSTK
jgi:hypothetical protein